MSERVPAYVDAARLCEELCISMDTIERMMATGKFPLPKTIFAGKRLWKWSEVEAAIDGKAAPAAVSGDIGQEAYEYAKAATAKRPHR